jgi:hypothetical protein
VGGVTRGHVGEKRYSERGLEVAPVTFVVVRYFRRTAEGP